MKKLLIEAVNNAAKEKRKLVFPLIGFPGLNLTNSNIKLAQQNYGEHYKAIKALCDLYKPDAVFPLMDLSVEANALGRYTVFPKEDSATVVKDHFCIEELEKLSAINITYDTRLLGYIETMRLMSIGLPENVLRGAYVTGPYTLAALIMGSDEAALATIMSSDDLHKICCLATQKILDYVRLLITAGAQVICILEPSAVMLGPDQFEQFSGKYVKRINASCENTPVATVYHICGNSMHLIEKMCEAGVDALSLDSPEIGIDLVHAAELADENVVIIGNIDPVGTLLNGTPEQVEEDVKNLLTDMKGFPNFILSSGCDLPQETPVENIKSFMETGRKFKFL